MADNNKLYETTQQLTQSIYDTNKTIAQSAVAAQERNAKFAQGVFENSIEVLKSHVEATQGWLQSVSGQSSNPQGVFQVTLDNLLAAQRRNVALVQSILEDSTRTAKSHVAATQELVQNVQERAQEQQRTLSELPYMSAYAEWFYAPLNYYKRAVETTQSLANQALDVAQQSAQQGMEVSQKVSQQVMDTMLTASRQSQQYQNEQQ